MPERVWLAPLPAADVEIWAEGVLERLSRPRVAARTWLPADAPAAASKLPAKLMPDGLATAEHHVLAICARATCIETTRFGYAWLQISGSDALIYDLEITDESLEATALVAVTSFVAGSSASLLRINVFDGDIALRRIVAGSAILGCQQPDASRPGRRCA